jgi:hypothetical protein
MIPSRGSLPQIVHIVSGVIYIIRHGFVEQPVTSLRLATDDVSQPLLAPLGPPKIGEIYFLGDFNVKHVAIRVWLPIQCPQYLQDCLETHDTWSINACIGFTTDSQ